MPAIHIPPTVERQEETETREVDIRREVGFTKFGCTDHCSGCIAAKAGNKAAGQSPACRLRIEKGMREDFESQERLEDCNEKVHARDDGAVPSSSAPAAIVSSVSPRQTAMVTDAAMAGKQQAESPIPFTKPQHMNDLSEFQMALKCLGDSQTIASVQEIFSLGIVANRISAFKVSTRAAFDFCKGWSLNLAASQLATFQWMDGNDPYLVIWFSKACSFF